MTATASFACGILLAIIVLTVGRREPEAGGPASKPTSPGWWTLAFGLIAVTALALAFWLPPNSNIRATGLWLASITFAFAAVVAGIGTVIRRDRHWPTWAGLVSGLIPAVFWIVFAAAEILGSGG